MTAAAVLTVRAALERAGCKPVQNGAGWKAHCPTHDDRTPSLTLNEGKDERALLKCQAGCATEDVIAALGIPWSDTFAPGSTPPPSQPRPQLGPWLYRDEQGVTLYRVRREDGPQGKRFLQERPDGKGGWIYGTGGARRVIYRLPEVRTAIAAGEVLYVVEGEKCADLLVALGWCSTCNPMGAGKWSRDYSAQLQGAKVVRVLADNDAPGRKHAQQVAEDLKTTGITDDVAVVEFPEQTKPDGSAGGDVADWLEQRRELPLEQRRKALLDFIEKATKPRRLPFVAARELVMREGPDVRWIVPGYLPAGALVEIDGKVKAGKSTFTASLVRAALDGGEFLGRRVERSKVVWLTEQSASSFGALLQRAGLEDRDDLLVLPWHDARSWTWPEVAAGAVEKALEIGAEVLIVDTLSQWAGLQGDDENNSGDALRALDPLQVGVGKGLAISLLRHERKSGGSPGDSGRGSSATPGAVDIVLALQRPEGRHRATVRVLRALSRYDETPAELMVEWVNGRYVSLGTGQDVARQEALASVLEVVPEDAGEALALKDVIARVNEDRESRGLAKLGRTTIQDAVETHERAGRLARSGSGRKGDPFRWIHSAAYREGVPAERIRDGGQTPEMLSAETTGGSGRMNPVPLTDFVPEVLQ